MKRVLSNPRLQFRFVDLTERESVVAISLRGQHETTLVTATEARRMARFLRIVARQLETWEYRLKGSGR